MLMYTPTMATLQKRKSRGHTYWSIVESRRVNGKPRPVILEYLGTANTLLKRLREGIPQKVQSYSHGIVAIMLDIAEELRIVETINKYVSQKQLRDGFTVGGSLLLAAIGRVCQPTSKRNWYEGWAKHTSLSYLIRRSLNKLDSQHFWDQMGALPVTSIPLIEEEIIKTLVKRYEITFDTLLCDTSNFFTYISSTNNRCSLAKRGRNKQKRMDLRQLGLLLLVSRQDQIPIFHKLYQGNLADKTVFKEHFEEVLSRFRAICGSLENITMVFDQGNNSKDTLKEVSNNVYFVGALSPYHHKGLIEEANRSFINIEVNGHNIKCYRVRSRIWGLDLTALVYISEKLYSGQVRGILQNINKLFDKLHNMKEKINTPTKKGRKRDRKKLENKITSLIASHVPDNLIGWDLHHVTDDAFEFDYWVDEEQFEILKTKWLGRRILITNRHQWATEEIISAYWGQSNIECVFKTIKNPFHLALRPQYHWTDQKIEVHGFICLLALLLVMVAYKKAKEKAGFKGSPHSLLERLSAIRLATFIENPSQKTRGRYRAVHCLEDMDDELYALAEAMGLVEQKKRFGIPFSVYN